MILKLYCPPTLVLLQQILIYRELNFSTNQIREIICAEDVDLVKSLDDQKSLLLSRQKDIQSMINSIEVAMNEIGKSKNYEALYVGIPKGKAERWDEMTRERYGNDFFVSALKNISSMEDSEVEKIRDEGAELGKAFANLRVEPADSTATQDIAKQYHKWLEIFLAATNKGFEVANSRVIKHYADSLNENEELSEFYDRYGPGTAKYLSEALTYYAKSNLD